MQGSLFLLHRKEITALCSDLFLNLVKTAYL